MPNWYLPAAIVCGLMFAATPVVISADRNVKYEAVVKTMDVLQRAGIQRVGLAVKNGAPADR